MINLYINNNNIDDDDDEYIDDYDNDDESMMMTYSFNEGSFEARIDFLPEISGITIFRGLSKVADVISNRLLRTTFVLIIIIIQGLYK